MEFVDFLNKRNASSTVKRYTKEMSLFVEYMEQKQVQTERATYVQILEYIGQQRKKYKTVSSVVCSLQAIKKYYSYLVQEGIRTDNPASTIRLRDNKDRDIQLQDLFKVEELELLLEKKERYPILKNRNRMVISLLIYQGLMNGEITRLEIKDIDLETATVRIKASGKSNARTLKLKPKQVLYIYKYVNEDRAKLIKEESEKLIIGKTGKAVSGEAISYIIESMQRLFKERKLNPRTIRQSVIANLLKAGKDLRLVQVFAGHKYPSTTEKYQQTKIEALKLEVLKYHPLG